MSAELSTYMSTELSTRASRGPRTGSRTGSLYAFNPRNTGLYEMRLWQAYYDRTWPLALTLLFRLLRSQFALAPLPALRATYWGIRAAIAFAPVEHDDALVLRLLVRFYTVIRASTDGRFDPSAAGDAEYTYWEVHRRLAGQTGSPELIEALTRIQMEMYRLSAEQARPLAVERAHACDLVDAITGGRQASTPEAWAAIAEALHRSYTLLREELTATE